MRLRYLTLSTRLKCNHSIVLVDNLLLLEDFISILLSDRCGVGGEFIS